MSFHKAAMHVAALTLLATCAMADIVTLTPSNLASYGWKLATANGGAGTFTVGGPMSGESTVGWPMGRGGLYMTCKERSGPDNATGAPSSVWLGLDKLYQSPGVFRNLALVKLKQIKRLEYFSYVPTIPAMLNKISELHYQWQPIYPVLHSTKDANSPYPNRRWWISRPWPYSLGVYGTENDRFGHWDDIDVVADNDTCAGWYNDNSHTKFDTWAEMTSTATNNVDNQRLTPTSTWWDPSPVSSRAVDGWMSAGYDDTSYPTGAFPASATGYPLNFFVGARKTSADFSGWYFDGTSHAWWRDNYGFKGCIDAITIGIDFSTAQDMSDYVETTFDLEPEPTAADLQTVAIAQKRMIKATGAGGYVIDPMIQSFVINKGQFRVKTWGKVVSVGTNSNFGYHFDLQDDAALPLPQPDHYDPPYPWNPEAPDKEALPQGQNLYNRPLPVRIHIGNVDFLSHVGAVLPQIGEYWTAQGWPHILSWDNPVPGGDVTEMPGQLYLYAAWDNCRKMVP